MNYFTPFEIAVYLIFIALVLVQFKKPKKDRNFFVLFSGLIFGIILELADMALWHTYSYGDVFLVYIFNVPLGIGTAWAVILHISILLSNKIGDCHGIPQFARPFMDALFVFSIDIVLDVVSVAHGGWKWLIANNIEWFGVPYENFVGWMSVALVFSFVVRILWLFDHEKFRRKVLGLPSSTIRMIVKALSPIIAYVFLFTLFVFQAAAVNTIYFIIKGKLAFTGSLMRPTVIYDPEISMIKGILFLIAVMVLVFVYFYFLEKRGVLKKSNLNLGKVDTVFMKKDPELFLSFLIMMSITLAILVALFMAGPYNAYALVFVQILVIAFNFFVFLVAFNCGSRKMSKMPAGSGKPKPKKRFK